MKTWELDETARAAREKGGKPRAPSIFKGLQDARKTRGYNTKHFRVNCRASNDRPTFAVSLEDENK